MPKRRWEDNIEMDRNTQLPKQRIWNTALADEQISEE
jgi:hypothetical protein